MKIEDFVHHLTKGHLDKVFGVEPLTFCRMVADYVMPSKAFLLCLYLGCGCKRMVHYDVKDAELVLKSDGNFYYKYILNATLSFTNHDRSCDKRLIVPDPKWAGLPTFTIKVGYLHKPLDEAMRRATNYVEEDSNVPRD
jgi:hypothetical protein